MKEDFLHYLWVTKKLPFNDLYTSQNQNLTIIDFGQMLLDEGPDVFNAKIVLDNQIWAGNIEIHVKASDWYLHRHEKNDKYDSIILHVVWENDSVIYRKSGEEIPVLELNKYCDGLIYQNYTQLIAKKSILKCESHLEFVDKFYLESWNEKLFIDRLLLKAEKIEKILNDTLCDWDQTFFILLTKSFGLNSNGEVFYELAKSIPYSILNKEKSNLSNLEALFLGMSNLLPSEITIDDYTFQIKQNFQFLKLKYNLKPLFVSPQFFKLRPDNFPTIRLVQLATLYNQKPFLFSELMLADSLDEYYKIFKINISEYWKKHYNFQIQHGYKNKYLTKSFIELIIINVVLPIKLVYHKYNNEENFEQLLNLAQQCKFEINNKTKIFMNKKLSCINALDSQAYIQLYNNYCDKNKCISCAIGNQVLKM